MKLFLITETMDELKLLTKINDLPTNLKTHTHKKKKKNYISLFF